MKCATSKKDVGVLCFAKSPFLDPDHIGIVTIQSKAVLPWHTIACKLVARMVRTSDRTSEVKASKCITIIENCLLPLPSSLLPSVDTVKGIMPMLLEDPVKRRERVL